MRVSALRKTGNSLRNSLRIHRLLRGAGRVIWPQKFAVSYLFQAYFPLMPTFCHHSILFSMFSLSKGLLAALQNVSKYYPLKQTGFSECVTVYLNQSSSNAGFITILFFSNTVFLFKSPPTHTNTQILAACLL